MRLREPALPRDVAALFSLAPAPTMEQRDLAPTMAAMSLSLASSIFPLSLNSAEVTARVDLARSPSLGECLSSLYIEMINSYFVYNSSCI